MLLFPALLFFENKQYMRFDACVLHLEAKSPCEIKHMALDNAWKIYRENYVDDNLM